MKRPVFNTLVAAALLASTGLAQAQHLRIGLQDDPDMLDPHRARTYVGRIVFASLCDKLIDIDANLHFVPRLATSWAWSDENRTLTFTLRTDAQFHDGSRFDAAAARANLERALRLPDSTRKGELASVDKIEAPDPATLVLRLKKPDATLLAQLSDRAGMMLSPQSFTDDVAAVGRAPICSGPYKFVERVQNDRIVLEKFAGHYAAADYHFDRVTFRPIPDTTVRLANLRAGSLDLLERMNPSDLPQAQADASVQVQQVSGLGWSRIVFNVANGQRAQTPIGQNKRVRQAFQLALDRSIINNVVGNGLFTPARQPYAPASPYHDAQQFPPLGRDVARAKALLQAAGYERVKVELVFGNTTATAAMAELIQAMVAEAGFDVVLRPTEYAAMLKEADVGNFEAQIVNWSGRIDPDGNIYGFKTCRGSLNVGRYCNPQVDTLLDQARTVADVAARKAIYDQVEAILQDELPAFYLYYQPLPFALSKKVQGFVPVADGMIRLQGVQFAS